MPPMIESTSTPRLTAICQPGTPVIPMRRSVSTGAEKGKMLKNIQIGAVREK